MRARAANIRWYGIPNPTPLEKIQIKAARESYAAANNISTKNIQISSPVIFDRINSHRARLFPPTRPILKNPKITRIRGLIDLKSEINEKIRQKTSNIEPRRNYEPTIKPLSSDEFKGFHRNVYTLNNINSIDGMYQMYKSVAGEQQNLSLIVRFSSPDPNLPFEYRTIPPQYLQSAKSFNDAINKFGHMTNLIGSDPICEGLGLDTSVLITQYFELIGQGKNPVTIIAKKTIKPKDSKAMCLWNAVFSQIDELPSYEIDKNIESAEEMEQHLIHSYGLGLKIYSDALVYTPSPELKYEEIDVNGKMQYLAEIKNDELAVFKKPSSECDDYVEIVYYDSHYIPYEGVKDGKFYFTRTCDIVHMSTNNDKLCQKTIKRNIVNNHNNKKCEKSTIEVVTFDVETRYDDTNFFKLQPYSISWKFQDTAYFYMGDDCITKFFDFLVERQKNTKFVLLGYNSSRFDNIFLIPELLDRDLLDNVFYQGNSVLNIKWGKRHTVHDICRFSSCALKDACTDFQTKYQKIGDFDHNVIQRHYNFTKNVSGYFHDVGCEFITKPHEVLAVEILDLPASDLTDKIKSLCLCKCDKYQKLATYNTFDVLSTHEIYTKIEEVCRFTGVIDKNIGLFDFKTIGSTIYKKFASDIADVNDKLKKSGKEIDKKYKLPLLCYNNYLRVRRGLFAGRTQCYNGIQYKLPTAGKQRGYRMLDVKSLYPYVALNRYYPSGDIINISYDECAKSDLIGFYQCTVNQSAMKINVIPLRSDKPLNWSYKGNIGVFLNTIDIKCILDYGGSAIIEKDDNGEDDGFAFSHKIHGSELFKCLNEFKKIKETQDIIKSLLKVKNDLVNNFTTTFEKLSYVQKKYVSSITNNGVCILPDYNPALRNMAKLFLNSLTGKVIESLHLDATELVKTAKDMERIIKRTDEMGQMQLSSILTKAIGIVSYKKRAEDVFKHGNRPIYLGCLIYAYARDHMYREILHDYKVIYQDTDSALISVKEFNRFKQNKPESLGGDFGQFEFEAGSQYFDSYVTLAPKNYFIYGVGPEINPKLMDGPDAKENKYRLYKKGFKGINLSRDKFIPDIEAPELEKYVHKTIHKDGTASYFIMNAFELYNDCPHLVKSVYDDCPRFIETVRQNGHAYILTSSLAKSMRTTTTGFEAGGIYARFLLKKINVD